MVGHLAATLEVGVQISFASPNGELAEMDDCTTLEK